MNMLKKALEECLINEADRPKCGRGGLWCAAKRPTEHTQRTAMYRPPWPTKLDMSHPWEVEHIWESHIGTVVDRLVAVGRAERDRTAHLSLPTRDVVSNAWKHARRLGAELFDLRGRFRKM